MSFILYATFFFGALVCAFFACILVKRIATVFNVVDRPSDAPLRKVHRNPIPLLGGVGLYATVILMIVIALVVGVHFSDSAIKMKHLIGIGLGGLILMIGGALDDRFRLAPIRQLIAPCLAVIVVIVSGIGISFITNPFGGQLRLDGIEYILFWFHGWPYKLTLIADLFTFVWLMGMMYTTKFLDGLDGLVSGVTVIGALIIAALSLDPVVGQKETALLAFIVAGAFSGFLLLNWHPARMFLGESGSLFAGFILGVLAILSGSKVMTTVLVLGIPMFDVLWVILRRVFWERRSPFTADKKHLHFRLLDIGFSHRQAVFLLYFFTAYFGVTALFLQSRGKIIALAILTLLMAILGGWLVYKRRVGSIAQ